MMTFLLSLLLLSEGFGSGNCKITFSAGFSDDMVLQRGPSSSAIYGLVTGSSPTDTIEVTVTDDHAGTSYSVTAPIIQPASDAAKAAAGGTTNPLCGSKCLAAGHCCTGGISACQMPSCAMGCIMAGRTPDVTACKASCTAANNKCEYTVVSPAGPHHLPGDTTQNQTFEMCSDGPILTNGTQCESCSGPLECEQGCEFGSTGSAEEALDVLSSSSKSPTSSLPGVWKVLLHPSAASGGGSFTISAATSSAGGDPTVLRRVTFGDVIVCSGQSNMDLALEYTFTKPALDAAVAAGKYSNIRLFQYGDMGAKYEELVPTWVTTQGVLNDPTDSGGTWGNLSTASKVIPGNAARPTPQGYNLLSQFSATCFYFASALTDEMVSGAVPGGIVPIGLIQSAIGGSQIEAWTPDTALGLCKNESLNADGQAPPGRLYNGMIAPFVNTTVRAFLWYQGENNCGGTMGNSATGVGYGCQLPAMIAEWRRQWSAVEGTTDKLAPFGVVTLAAGGSEGHDQNMAGMRWSQSGNYGALPNKAMPNTFLAHAYDLGDPMDNLQAPCVNGTGYVNTSAFGPNGPCIWPEASAWNPATAPLRDVVFKNAAPSFMGGIHPRFKHEVGRRLALAYTGTTFPAFMGCTATAKTVTLEFNADDLKKNGGDSIVMQWSDEQWNVSAWTTGSKDSSAMMVCVGKADGSTKPADCIGDASLWYPAPLMKPSSPSTVSADLTNVKGLGASGVLAVRYGWPLSQGADTCCPSGNVMRGREPCVPGACPLITAKSSLPANPFYATISSGKCECMAPQQC